MVLSGIYVLLLASNLTFLITEMLHAGAYNKDVSDGLACGSISLKLVYSQQMSLKKYKLLYLIISYMATSGFSAIVWLTEMY